MSLSRSSQRSRDIVPLPARALAQLDIPQDVASGSGSSARVEGLLQRYSGRIATTEVRSPMPVGPGSQPRTPVVCPSLSAGFMDTLRRRVEDNVRGHDERPKASGSLSRPESDVKADNLSG